MSLKPIDEPALENLILKLLRFEPLDSNTIIRRIWETTDIEKRVPSLGDNDDIRQALQKLRRTRQIELINSGWRILVKERV